MKKLFLLPLLALLPILFTSCDDKDGDLPNVRFSVNIGGDAKVVDGTIYIMPGQTLNVEGIYVTNNEEGKNAAINGATYYWDYYIIGNSPIAPFGMEIPIPANEQPGNHILEIGCTVLAVDKAPANAVLAYNVKIVSSEDEIPDGEVATSITSGGEISASN